MAIVEDKIKLRKTYRNRRNSISLARREALAKSAFSQLLTIDAFINSKNPLIYSSLNSEISTDPVISWYKDSNRHFYLPKVLDNNRMSIGRVNSLEDCEDGEFSIIEPKKEFIIDNIDIIDFILLPGVAFDITGGRLGQGGGYYDRFLERISRGVPLVGYCYDEQIVTSLMPQEPHDLSVSTIVTPTRVIPCL